MLVEISKLKVHPLHRNIYKSNDIQDLKDSIHQVGLLTSIIVNKDFLIISGVRRYLAVKELGYKFIRVEFQHNFPKDESLMIVSYNKQREKTVREKLNEIEYLKTKWKGKRGRKSLNAAPSVKTDTRANISNVTGISAGNISKLEYINKHMPKLLDEIDNGNISINQAHNSLVKFEIQKNITSESVILPTTITNNHYTIYNKSSYTLSELKDESIQTIFTSPPYWNKRTYSKDSEELGGEPTSEQFVQRMVNHLHACYRVLKPSGSLFLNIGDTYHNKCLQCIPELIAIELIKKSWILRSKIIWHKINVLNSNAVDNVSPSWEYIFHFTKNEKYDYYPVLAPKQTVDKTVNIICQKKRDKGNLVMAHVSVGGLKDGKQLTDFWTEDVVKTATATQSVVKRYGGTDHPAPFPAIIPLLPILQTTKPGDLVLDPFSGSATTGAVALMLGRQYVGYEFNPIHNEVQKKRLDDSISIGEQIEEKLKNAVLLYNKASELSQAA